MKKTLLTLLTALFSFAQIAYADTYVEGYSKKDGTYVQGYWKSTPNSTNLDNFSTKENSNPYTGKEGSRAQDYSPEAERYGSDKTIETGPRGGQYYYNDSGRKVYVPKR